MSDAEVRDKNFFIRMSEKEMEVLDLAVKLRYGGVRGNKSKFARNLLLKAAMGIIREEAKKRRGEE